jgi:hypothetical protein
MEVLLHQVSTLDQDDLAAFVGERRVDVSGVSQNVVRRRRRRAADEKSQRDQNGLQRVRSLF